MSARAGLHIFRRGQATEFERLGNLRLNGFLKLVQGFLRIEESARNRVAQHRLTLALELPNFLAAQRQ